MENQHNKNTPISIKIVTVFILLVGAVTFFQGIKEIASGISGLDIKTSFLRITVGLLFGVSAFAMRYMKKWGLILFILAMIPILFLFITTLMAVKNVFLLIYLVFYLAILFGAVSQWKKFA